MVFGWGVEFVPVDAGAVSHRDPGRLPCAQRAVFPGFPVERLDLSVRDGVGREPRVGFRMHGVLVAPPAHRLDPPAPGTGPGAGVASRGCVACGYEGPCVQKDDVEMIRQNLLASHMVVFATPLYYHGMSAQLKLVVDRFCAYNSSLNSRHLKSALLAVAGSHGNHMAVNVDCICFRNLSAIGENV